MPRWAREGTGPNTAGGVRLRGSLIGLRRPTVIRNQTYVVWIIGGSKVQARARTRGTRAEFRKRALSMSGHLEHAVPPELVLRHVVLLTRHGDRAPISARVGNFKVDDGFWKQQMPRADDVAHWDARHPVEDLAPAKRLDHAQEVFGQLTARGAEQLTKLGNAMHTRLQCTGHHLLHSPSSVTARSTNIRRTVQSAQNFLLGLKAPAACAAKVQVREWAEENLVPNLTRCPPLGSVLKAAEAAEQTRAAADAPELKRQLAATFGLASDRALPTSKCREILVCVVAHQQPLPRGVSPQIATQVAELDARDWGRRYRPTAVARLGMGPLLDELRAGLRAVVEGRAVGGVALLSGHDTTLVALLCALGAYDDRPVEYGSHLLLELAEDDLATEFYVRVLYNWQPLHLLAPVGAEPPAQPAPHATPAASASHHALHYPHGAEWIEWRRFETDVLVHALSPVEHAAAADSATAALASRGHEPGQRSSDSAAMALQSMQDVLVGSRRS